VIAFSVRLDHVQTLEISIVVDRQLALFLCSNYSVITEGQLFCPVPVTQTVSVTFQLAETYVSI